MGKTFGCDTTGLSWGVFKTHKTDDKAKIAKDSDENGKVTDEQAYSRTLTEEGTFSLNGAVPRSGTKIDLGGGSKLITSISVTKKNDGYAEGTVTTEQDDESTQVEYEEDTPST